MNVLSHLPMGVFGPGLWSLKSLVEFHFLDPDRLRLDMEPLSGRPLLGGVMGGALADGGPWCPWLAAVAAWMAAVRSGAVEDLKGEGV